MRKPMSNADVATLASADLELAERHRYGDTDAFEEVYARYEPMVYNLALRMTAHEEDAADLTQETFLRVYRSLGGFRGRSSLKTWVFRVALNCCRSRLRRRARRRRYHEPGEELERVADSARGPEDRVIAGDVGAQVEAALAGVPRTFREALVLRDLQGLSYREIAQVLGVRIGTVRSRLARGRERLRRLLETTR